MNDARTTLNLLRLDERRLPSGGTALRPMASGPVAIAQPSHPLHGSGSGTYRGPAISIARRWSLTWLIQWRRSP